MDKENIDISIVILAYAEADNLKNLLPLVKHYAQSVKYTYEIIVVDGTMARDNSGEVCKLCQVRYVNQRYPDFGGAFKTAIEEIKGRWVLTLDGDGSHNPKYIPAMLEMFQYGDYDVVIGSRYVKGGGSDASSISILMSRVLNFSYRFFLGIHAKDVSTNFRVYYSEQLKQIQIETAHYDVLEEVLVKLSILNRRKLYIGEVPIKLDKRISGQSKRRLIPFMISYIKTLFRLIMMRIREKRYVQRNDEMQNMR